MSDDEEAVTKANNSAKNESLKFEFNVAQNASAECRNNYTINNETKNDIIVQLKSQISKNLNLSKPI